MSFHPHLRIVFRGDFVGTPEQWSFGTHFSRESEGAPDAGIDDIDQEGVTAAVTTFFTGGDSGIPTNVKLTDWRAYVIGTDGRMVGNPLLVDTSSLSISGGVGPKYPPQIAAVVTTVAANRGPGRFGRFYLPTAVALGTDRRVSVTDATAIAEASTTFLKAVSDSIDLAGVTNSSVGLNVSGVGAGLNQTIDHVEVGRVLDTLRNRRKSLLEERHVHGHIDW